jgi:hypothetical protein
MSMQSKRRLSTAIIPPVEFNAIQRRQTLSVDQQTTRRSINTAQYDILEAAGMDYQMTIQDENDNSDSEANSIIISVNQSPTLDVESLLQRRKSLFEIKMDVSDLQNIKRVPSSRKHSIDAFSKRNSIDIASRKYSVVDLISRNNSSPSKSNSLLDVNSIKNSSDALNQSMFRRPKKRIILTPAQKQEMREGS